MQKHGKPATLRQVAPVGFVLSLIVLIMAGILWSAFWWLLAAELLFYLLGITYGSFDVGRQAGWKHALLAPVVFSFLHFGYGFGSLWGLVRFILLSGKGMRKPADMELSR